MIIRHDLELVFVHVPKCAGKQLRSLFKRAAPEGAVEELWNYSYSPVLRRYVDLAHLPLADLRHWPAFALMERYRVVASIRNPYHRLPSAVNEYYRQKSKRHEQKVKDGTVSASMRRRYYRQLPKRHQQLDPRFIHSLPMHQFTHYGSRPMVDHLLRCESLRRDAEALAEELNWPDPLREAVAALPAEEPTPPVPDADERQLAEQLYQEDFHCFGYPCPAPAETASPDSKDAGRVNRIHSAARLHWHWGPTAEQALEPLQPLRHRH